MYTYLPEFVHIPNTAHTFNLADYDLVQYTSTGAQKTAQWLELVFKALFLWMLPLTFSLLNATHGW